jgi:hypothetical protein
MLCHAMCLLKPSTTYNINKHYDCAVEFTYWYLFVCWLICADLANEHEKWLCENTPHGKACVFVYDYPKAIKVPLSMHGSVVVLGCVVLCYAMLCCAVV